MNLNSIVFCILGLPALSWALECYVCKGQRDNRDKCIKTAIQCEEKQDTCKTKISWKQPDFWQPRSIRYHYIEKSCDSKEACSTESNNLGLKSMRDWYRDWIAIECCQGDRCNFYVTMGAGTKAISFLLLGVTMVMHFVLQMR